MSRRRKDPLRPLTDDEREELTRLSRCANRPGGSAARAVMLLAVRRRVRLPTGGPYAGRKSGDAVSHLVARFNREGLPRDDRAEELLALDDALAALARREPVKAEVVKLRYFAGLSLDGGGRLPGHLPGHGQAVLGRGPGLAVRRPRRGQPAGPR